MPGRLLSLTSLRFFAAFVVLVGHAFNQFHPFDKIYVIPVGTGVAFFFILSGIVFIVYERPLERRLRAALRPST